MIGQFSARGSEKLFLLLAGWLAAGWYEVVLSSFSVRFAPAELLLSATWSLETITKEIIWETVCAFESACLILRFHICRAE